MKHLFFIWVLSSCLSLASTGQSITFGFTGKTLIIETPMNIDSVYILNNSNGSDTLVVGNSFSTSITSIDLSGTGTKNVVVSYPNPFIKEVNIQFFSNFYERAKIALYALDGKRLSEWNSFINAGENKFRLKSGEQGVLLLSVLSKNIQYHSTLICLEESGRSEIIQISNSSGNADKLLKSEELNNPFVFSFGDSLSFLAYSGIIASEPIMDKPAGDKSYSFVFDVSAYLPVADFTANVTTINEGEEISFSDLSTNSPSTWNWDFGDGSTSDLQNPTHIYNASGTYSVTLIVSNEFGTDTITKQDLITVTAAKPVADFTANVTTINEGEEISFSDLSTNSPSIWNWDFGDGSTSDLQNPTHIYNASGTYTVTLIVSNEFGADAITKSEYIQVLEEPNPVLSVIPVVLAFDTTSTQKILEITNSGTGTLNWSASETLEWLTVSPSTGTTTTETDTITVTVNRSGLTTGDYSGVITISSNGGNTAVDVSMNVKEETPELETPKEPGWDN